MRFSAFGRTIQRDDDAVDSCPIQRLKQQANQGHKRNIPNTVILSDQR